MAANKVRWTIVVPKSLDLAVREYLGRQGAKKGALSEFVENAVKRRLGAERAIDAKVLE